MKESQSSFQIQWIFFFSFLPKEGINDANNIKDKYKQ